MMEGEFNFDDVCPQNERNDDSPWIKRVIFRDICGKGEVRNTVETEPEWTDNRFPAVQSRT